MNYDYYSAWTDYCQDKGIFIELINSTHALTERDYGKDSDREVTPHPYHREGSIKTHINMVYHEAVIRNDNFLKILALCHDLAKPFMRHVKHYPDKPSRVYFSGHDYASALMSLEFLKKNFNTEEVNFLLELICNHTKSPLHYTNETEKKWMELLTQFQECDDKGRITDINLDKSILKESFHREKTDGKWVTFLIGIPGCGKSFYSKTCSERVFSTDQYLLDIAKDKFNVTDYNEAFKVMTENDINWKEILVKDLIEYKEDAVFDATNLTKKGRMGITHRLKNRNIRYVLIWRDLWKCIESCGQTRENGKIIPLHVLKSMIQSFSYPIPEEYTELTIIHN